MTNRRFVASCGRELWIRIKYESAGSENANLALIEGKAIFPASVSTNWLHPATDSNEMLFDCTFISAPLFFMISIDMVAS